VAGEEGNAGTAVAVLLPQVVALAGVAVAAAVQATRVWRRLPAVPPSLSTSDSHRRRAR
jgi:hypothetical protein